MGYASQRAIVSYDADDSKRVKTALCAGRTLLPNGAFDTQLVAAVVTRGKAFVAYTVEAVTFDKDGTASVRYTTKITNDGRVTFAYPLVVGVPKAGMKKWCSSRTARPSAPPK